MMAGVFTQAEAHQACESLAALKLANTTITIARSVAAGAFVSPVPAGPPGGGPPPTDFKSLPAFCRIAATLRPTKDSDIKVEVWMPIEQWNGRFLGRGNGGLAGSISYDEIGAALQQNYVSASTNTGHSAAQTDGSWALGHPEKVADFGYRGIHEMTRLAKATIKAFYGSGPRYSYFGSCSNGGRQALMEAQRFPTDYDGILAGAPANYWTHVGVWTNALLPALDHGGYIPSTKLPAIARAVNAACDARDGVSDGILNDPRTCDFDPATLLCKAGDSEKCLTEPQVAVLKKLYAGPHDAQGREIYPGYMPGAEEGPNGWATWITGPAPGKALMFAFGHAFFSDIVYGKAAWDFKDVDVDKAVKDADAKTARILNATDPNLAAFKARGGKLILYHGWADPALAPLNTINYYNSVKTRMGKRPTAAFTRLYMVPGMQHCAGGPGPFTFGQNGPSDREDPQHNISLALKQWVEKGVAPSSIIATKYVEDDPRQGLKMTRPLCPYPQTAKWSGKGSTDDAANFTCNAP
jgi:feruloyl esterase